MPNAADSMLYIAREESGLDLSVGDWQASLFSSQMTANDVVLRVRGKYNSNELLRADKITLEVSAWKYLFKDYNLSSAINEIKVVDLKIHLEHKNGIQWNTGNAINSRKLTRFVKKQCKSINNGSRQNHSSENEGKSGFSIGAIHLVDSQIEWIEETSGQSKDGIIEKRRKEFYIDDAEIVLNNIEGLCQDSPSLIALDFDARAGAGVIQISGEFNPFLWGTPFGNMVLDALFTPDSGAISGNVLFGGDLSQSELITYKGNINLNDVTWRLNKLSKRYTRATAKRIEKTRSL